MPVEIGKLRNLSCLDLSQNRDLHHLPDEMGRLDYLFYVRSKTEIYVPKICSIIFSQLNIQGLRNLNVSTTMNTRAIISYLKSKLHKVLKTKLCLHTNNLIHCLICLHTILHNYDVLYSCPQSYFLLSFLSSFFFTSLPEPALLYNEDTLAYSLTH